MLFLGLATKIQLEDLYPFKSREPRNLDNQKDNENSPKDRLALTM